MDRFQRRRLIARERERARERELAQAREIEKAHTALQQAHEHLKTTQQQLIQQEKLASLGQLTAGIAHEIKNPLNFVNNFAEINTELAEEVARALALHRRDIPEGLAEELEALMTSMGVNANQIAKHGKRADHIVESMMEHAGGKSERYEVAINPLVEEFVNITYNSHKTRIPDLEVEIERNLDASAGSLTIAPQDIGRVLQNIIGNAIDAVYKKKQSTNEAYEPKISVTTRRENGQVEIRISDNGPGIPKQVRDRVFEPFFTTKPTGSGTGLGLSLSYDIVTHGHGGSLEMESVEGEGATFVVRLPAS